MTLKRNQPAGSAPEGGWRTPRDDPAARSEKTKGAVGHSERRCPPSRNQCSTICPQARSLTGGSLQIIAETRDGTRGWLDRRGLNRSMQARPCGTDAPRHSPRPCMPRTSPTMRKSLGAIAWYDASFRQVPLDGAGHREPGLGVLWVNAPSPENDGPQTTGGLWHSPTGGADAAGLFRVWDGTENGTWPQRARSYLKQVPRRNWRKFGQ